VFFVLLGVGWRVVPRLARRYEARKKSRRR
jgi:hypothetical protein